MDILDFRESFLNEDIIAESISTSRYAVEVFIEKAADILKNDYSLLSEISQCYIDSKVGTRSYKTMHIDAAYLDLASNVLNLLYADYNEGEITNITNEFLNNKAQLLMNYFENTLKGYFISAEQADPAVQLAKDIRDNAADINTIHLFIVSTNRLSKSVRKLELSDYSYNGRTYKIAFDVLDIDGIYRSKLAGFKKEDVIINCSDFGIEGIPCIKADIETDQYESYLAIVPGEFLSEIYKKYNASLLEANVRSFLKFNGSVNKGIRGTILNEKSRFFTYNNGISTTAKSIKLMQKPDKGLMITSFTDLQIINGGQTTATLAATSIKHKANLSGIFVQMKLTILSDENPELIRNIAKYANSQNKVKTADLNSSHPFYVRMEDFSRKIYAPLATGNIVQQLWFFERVRGQYDQPLMQLTEAQAKNYKLTRPKQMKFTLSDLAKYENASNMYPYFVSWGGEVNAAHFHNEMEKQWNKNDAVYNKLFYKELIAKKILFTYIGNIISELQWYQENRAYRPQLIAYTFSKLVQVIQNSAKMINYKQIWDMQAVPPFFEKAISEISEIIFNTINSPDRSTANIETYCKKQECWNIICKIPYEIDNDLRNGLISTDEKNIENIIAKKEQRLNSEILDEVSIYNKGYKYWASLIVRGKLQSVLSTYDCHIIEQALYYCEGKYMQLSKKQVKEILAIKNKLKENGIE